MNAETKIETVKQANRAIPAFYFGIVCVLLLLMGGTAAHLIRDICVAHEDADNVFLLSNPMAMLAVNR